MIVKVQLPLATNDTTPHALVYSEDRSIHVQLPISRELTKLMRKRGKAYFAAHMRGTELMIDYEVKEQSW